MGSTTVSNILKPTLAMVAAILWVANCWATTNETVLHTFTPGGAEAFPYGGLVADHAGNLYGTSYYGGTYNDGTVFELTPVQGGGWTQKVLHSFNQSSDGAYPNAGVVFDSAGNLYTTTRIGGIYEDGTVVELSPAQDGNWTETVLHNFNGSDGDNPWGGLVIDRAGNLYGTTSAGGTQFSGTVFELSPSGSGNWVETVLHNFSSKNATRPDGTYPYSGLQLDAAGNLYGTTSSGGTYDYGTVFELTPHSGGGWTEKLLHSFNNNGSDGVKPFDSLIIDAVGNLYGTTLLGGINNSGTVFEMSPNGSGRWTETVLFSFGSLGSGDGYAPYGGVIFDSAGNLYGTTEEGGTHYRGNVFELSPDGGGGWTETVLHSFRLNGFDGTLPRAGLFSDAAGNLFGTTSEGGTYNDGTMFELSRNDSGGWTERVYSFDFNGIDGAFSESSLISDSAGNLYGTTYAGGNSAGGAVFEMSPNGSGGWTEKLLYSFGEALTGFGPMAALTFDAEGNLYGTTSEGGLHQGGTVFELSPNGSGGWTERALHSFGAGNDGSVPYYGPLIFDSAGNLYGTTLFGSNIGLGTVFKIAPNGSGGWTETVLYSFNYNGTDGYNPAAGLVFDTAGNLYGTTYSGGAYNLGTVFELSPNGSGGWTETVLYSFNADGSDGNSPRAGLIFDNAGSLYGTTLFGGTNDDGTVFKLSPSGSGGWTETVLHSFGFDNSDGDNPWGGLIFDSAGNLYGTTGNGGTAFYGTVFELSPDGRGGWTETVLHNFGGANDGSNPDAGLLMDQAGNLYGTTGGGGIGGWTAGTVFEITR